MSYRELPPPAPLARLVRCEWLRVPAARGSHRVLPDGCADIVWTGDRLVVAGPDTGPVLVADSGGEAAVGVRFRPGAAAAALGLPAAELLDERVALDALWGAEGRRLEAAVAAADGPAARLTLLRAAVARRASSAPPPDPLVAAAVARVARDPARPVRALAGELALSERHLHRRFSVAVGYGPKTFARVARFRRALRLLGDPVAAGGLARVALDAGYADQQHLARECGALAGVPPSLLRAAA